MGDSRINDLRKFYQLLGDLEDKLGGARILSACTGRLGWPARGIYFFFESGECRVDSGKGMRVVRVGTHALAPNSKTSLWNRLSQHRGTLRTGGGNHRCSIFRLLTGEALSQRHVELAVSTWGIGTSASSGVRNEECDLEARVSAHIGEMPLLWLTVDDDPGNDSLRGVVDRNSIALLSNFRRPGLDAPSEDWLGRFSKRDKVRKSGLWNQNHVDEQYDPAFLKTLANLISQTQVLP